MKRPFRKLKHGKVFLYVFFLFIISHNSLIFFYIFNDKIYSGNAVIIKSH